MLIIRFARRGRKGQAFFDLVVAEKSKPVQKKFINKLGFFNPRTEGGKGEFVFDKEQIEKYIKNGAQVSQSAARLLAKNGCELAGKFIEQRVSKPKKTQAPKEPVATEAPVEKTEEVVAEAPTKEASPSEEVVPVEEEVSAVAEAPEKTPEDKKAE